MYRARYRARMSVRTGLVLLILAVLPSATAACTFSMNPSTDYPP